MFKLPFEIFYTVYYLVFSGVVRGVAGVAKATPIFQLLSNKIVLKILTKNFLFTNYLLLVPNVLPVYDFGFKAENSSKFGLD